MVRASRVCLTAVVLVVSVSWAGRFTPAVLLGFRHEPGVETKMLVTGLADASLNPRLDLDAALGLGFMENNGIAGYALGARVQPLATRRLFVEARIQHQQWSDWRAGENRVLGLVRAEVSRRVRLSLGAAYRVPVFDPACFASPFQWQSDAPEWNLLYGINWTFIERRRLSAFAFIANSDRMTLHNPQQVPLGLYGSYQLARGCSLCARARSGIVGISGALVSFSEFVFEAGVSRAF
jgi:hypothetical protein